MPLPLNKKKQNAKSNIRQNRSKGTFRKNLTTFTIEVGLHPKDIDKILDLICKEVKEGCKDTKRCVEEFNKEREYLSGTLNVK